MNIKSPLTNIPKPASSKGPSKNAQPKPSNEPEQAQRDGFSRSAPSRGGDLFDMGVNMMMGGAGGGVGGLLAGAVLANHLGMGSLGVVGMAAAGGVVLGASGTILGAVLT